jgi:hypothetical protein
MKQPVRPEVKGLVNRPAGPPEAASTLSLEQSQAVPPPPSRRPTPEPTTAVTVRVNHTRYEKLRRLSYETGKTHKDLFIEGLDLLLERHGIA